MSSEPPPPSRTPSPFEPVSLHIRHPGPPLPPRLPPRNPSTSSTTPQLPRASSSYSDHLSPTTTHDSDAPPPYALQHDPRTSSTASLHHIASPHPDGRRTLLLIYIHGFMGNETSFQSFPAHLHNVLVAAVPSHTIHTKVYPKFKTREHIAVAAENFSRYLTQFEGAATDVVLLGHSMGGLLAADIALLPRADGGGRRHEILGVVAFDAPFLGMHPGVISAGLSSIFNPAPSPAASPPVDAAGRGEEEWWNRKPDRNYTVVQSRKESGWEAALGWVQKHKGEVKKAAGRYLVSHLEFGGCLADPAGLKRRWEGVKGLEAEGVGFVNYYTVSFGRDKAERTKSGETVAGDQQPESTPLMENGIPAHHLDATETHTPELHLPDSVLDSRRTSEESLRTLDPAPLDPTPLSPRTHPSGAHHSPRASTDSTDTFHDAAETHPAPSAPPDPLQPPPLSLPHHSSAPTDSPPAPPAHPSLPPLPPPPTPPTLTPTDNITDRALLKTLQSENKALLKTHQRALRDHAKLVARREKLLDDIRRREEKAAREIAKQAEKRRSREEREAEREGLKQGKRLSRQLGQQEAENERLRGEAERMERERLRMLGVPPGVPAENRGVKREDTPPPVSGEGELPGASGGDAAKEGPHAKEKEKKSKPPRERKFCITPSAEETSWVKVEMKGVDEVGAHCGLFFMSETYERLVGDVAGRVEGWVQSRYGGAAQTGKAWGG